MRCAYAAFDLPAFFLSLGLIKHLPVEERHRRNAIRKKYPDLYESKRIVCLYIPDDYDFMDKYLQILLKEKFEDVLARDLI